MVLVMGQGKFSPRPNGVLKAIKNKKKIGQVTNRPLKKLCLGYIDHNDNLILY